MKALENAKRAMFEPGISATATVARRRDQIKKYSRERRKYEKIFFGGMTLPQQRRLHAAFSFGVRINNRLNGERCTVVSDERRPGNKPRIYAATHIGKMDIELLLVTRSSEEGASETITEISLETFSGHIEGIKAECLGFDGDKVSDICGAAGACSCRGVLLKPLLDDIKASVDDF